MLPYKIRIALKVLIQKTLGNKVNLVSDERFNQILFRLMFGRKADFKNPKTFNECVCARKLQDKAFSFWKYSDKYEVRKYVEETIGREYLNECYGIYDSFSQIDFSKLPERFALRGTHGSGYNIIVKDKSSFNRKKAKKKFDKWLKTNYYHVCRERNYAKIKPRIMCDRYLESIENDDLPEIKVFCFYGKAKLIGYNLCKNGKTYTNMFDGDWNYLDIRKGYAHFSDKSAPQNAAEILRIAENLAKPFEFVRVDLYNVDGKVYFSELTFFTGGGFVPFDPPEYDEKMVSFFNKVY